MGVRHHHGHQGAAAAGAGTGDIMGRLAWRHGRSRAPFRPWRAVHQPRVHHQGRGIRHASLDRHGRRLVRQRHGRERQRRVQDRARLATQALPGFEGPGIGDVPVGLVAGTRSVCTSPWATGHRNGPKPSIMQTKRRKPPHYKGGTKIRPYQSAPECAWNRTSVKRASFVKNTRERFQGTERETLLTFPQRILLQ